MPDDKNLDEFGFDGEFDPERARKLIDKQRRREKELEAKIQELEAQAQDLTNQARFRDLQSEYGAFLSQEDFEGLSPDKWEARAARLADLHGDKASESKAQDAGGEATPPKPEEAELGQLSAGLDKVEAGQGTPQSYTASELISKYQNGEIGLTDMSRMVEQGQMKKAKQTGPVFTPPQG